MSAILQDRVAAISGGTRGIGRGIAEALLAAGASVVVNGRDPQKGAAALEQMNAGTRAHFIAGDCRLKSDCEALVDETVAHYGRIDVLVNNAGGAGAFAPVVEMTDEAWQEAIDWNLNSTFWCTRRALQHMIPRRWGRIINISSIEGKHGKPGIAQYVAAKHGVNGFTKGVAKEVGTLGVTVNAICPGLVLTDIVRAQGQAAAAAMGKTFEEMVQQFAAESAIQRVNTVEEVAAVAVLLASEVGAGITGALWSVDGGTAAY